MAEKSANIRIEPLLDEVVKKKASDLHLQVGLPPIIRVDGKLTPVSGAEKLTEESVETLIFAILPLVSASIFPIVITSTFLESLMETSTAQTRTILTIP